MFAAGLLLVATAAQGATPVSVPAYDTGVRPAAAGLVSTNEIGTLLVEPGNLWQGLQLYYPFDQDEGDTVTDQSGTGNHATVAGAQWVAAGRYGGGYHFSGAKQMLLTRELGNLGGSYSFAMWVKFDHFINDYPIVLSDTNFMATL
jgi:hypothetical protein